MEGRPIDNQNPCAHNALMTQPQPATSRLSLRKKKQPSLARCGIVAKPFNPAVFVAERCWKSGARIGALQL